jgi:hypothetical protein
MVVVVVVVNWVAGGWGWVARRAPGEVAGLLCRWLADILASVMILHPLVHLNQSQGLMHHTVNFLFVWSADLMQAAAGATM